jgi:succinate dehydrogenase/fumarate reductase flavoprotein subunit
VPPQRQNLLLKLPPWPWLAQMMAWSLDRLPSALLRPFIMSFVTTALAPSPDLFESGALLVNRSGERFTDERGQPALAVPDQPGGDAFILLDARLAGLFTGWPHFVSTAPGVAYAYLADYRRNRRDIYHAAPTLEALARKLGMRHDMLAQAVASHTQTGNRATFGAGPYVALGPARAVFVHNEGGLAVDLDHRVLGADDKPIDGLYAAGATGQGGLLLKGHGHHLAWAFVSGRRAGRNAAGHRSGF